MKKLHLLFTLAVFSVTGIAQELHLRPDTNNPLPYDTSKETKIKAKVTDVKEGAGVIKLVNLFISIDGKDYRVPVASADYLKEKNVSFAKGDEIVIVGVMMEAFGNLLVSAREIKKGEITLTLQDKEGNLFWRQQRSR